VASLFHTKIQDLDTKTEQEKALKETIIRVKNHSVEEATRSLDPTDMAGLQRLMEAKRSLQDLQKLHISID
jgi:DNA primase